MVLVKTTNISLSVISHITELIAYLYQLWVEGKDQFKTKQNLHNLHHILFFYKFALNISVSLHKGSEWR